MVSSMPLFVQPLSVRHFSLPDRKEADRFITLAEPICAAETTAAETTSISAAEIDVVSAAVVSVSPHREEVVCMVV